jgi:predicted transglutaminase-like protease
MSFVELTCLCSVHDEPEQSNDASFRHLSELIKAAAHTQEGKPQEVEIKRDPPAELNFWIMAFLVMLMIMLVFGGIMIWMIWVQVVVAGQSLLDTILSNI